MHLVTNTIFTGSKVPSLSEVFKAARTKQALEKTASSNETVKTATNIAQVQQEIKKAGEPGKGNVANLTAPKFGPGGKKTEKAEEKGEKTDKKEEPKGEGEEKDSCAPCTAGTKIAAEKETKKDEGETSGQPQAEAKLVNDPNKDPKLSEGKKGDSKGTPESEEAESSGQLDVEPLHQKGESTDEKPGDLDTEKTKKEAGRFNLDTVLNPRKQQNSRDGYGPAAHRPKKKFDTLEPVNEKGEFKKRKSDPAADFLEKHAPAAAEKTVENALKKTARFVRISELTPKQKEFLRSVYSVFWPKAFIDALLA